MNENNNSFIIIILQRRMKIIILLLFILNMNEIIFISKNFIEDEFIHTYKLLFEIQGRFICTYNVSM